MSLAFDATLKALVAERTSDFETILGLRGPVPGRVLNVDLSTVSAATDIVLGYGDPPQRLVDLNFESGRTDDLSAKLLLYNALLHRRYGVPVHSVVILLRPKADAPGLNGWLRYQGQPRRGLLAFRFEVIRLWRQPVSKLLQGGLGTLPLATLGRLPAGVPLTEGLAQVIQRIEQRLVAEAAPAEATKLMTAAFILTGLRITRQEVQQLYRGLRAMEDSTSYQYILDVGRLDGQLKEARKIVLRLGRRQCGTPPKSVRSALEGITDLDRLERMTDRVLTATTWAELLATL